VGEKAKGCREREREVNINEPTMRGSQFDQRAQERMIIKNPTARTKESRITARYRGVFERSYGGCLWAGDVLLRPAAMLLYLDNKFICIAQVAERSAVRTPTMNTCWKPGFADDKRPLDCT
jgi:hypothetical protein